MISGDLLREARLRAGLTQRELARRAHTSQPAIARWESGDVVPSFERLRELVRACGLELTFGLANYDDSYDEFIEEYLALPPGERVQHALRRAEAFRKLGALGGPSFDPVNALETLERHQVCFVVVGAVAAIAQAYPLPTDELEVLPERDPDNLRRLAAALEEIGAEPYVSRVLGETDSLTVATPHGDLVLILRSGGTSGYADIMRDALEADLGTGTPALVASLRDVIRMKEASGREKDRAQLPALRRTLEVIRRRERRDDE